MKYPVDCKNCAQALYGPVKYCPFCGVASVSVDVTDDKQKFDTLRSKISSSLSNGEYDPDIRGFIRQKGKEIGVTEAAADSLLLAELKEKGFSPVIDGANDPLAVEWSTEEKKPKEVILKQPETTTTEEPQPKPEKTVEVKTISTPPEQGMAKTPATVELSKEAKTEVVKPSKPLFWKVVVVLGIVVIIGGMFYGKKGSFEPSAPKTEQKETSDHPKKTRRKAVEPPKPQVKQNFNQQPAAIQNVDAGTKKIKRDADKQALAKVEAERQRREQLMKQREIEDYLSEGKRFFGDSKYELCIEKMKEVIRRDRGNIEANRYIGMASQKLRDIKRQWEKAPLGESE